MSRVKILQMNVWGGRIKDGLSRYIAEGDYDVVCMQEAPWGKNDAGYLDLFIDTVDKIKKIGGFLYDLRTSAYGVSLLGGSERLEEGNVIISKIPFGKTEEKSIFGEYSVATGLEDFKDSINDRCYNAQKVKLENGLTIVNHHGYWLPNPIGDETTIECMGNVAKFIRDEEGPLVMCGDLNVSAESPAMRKIDFLKDLTALNDVKTTLMNVRFVKDVPCDHILVSDNLKYDKFRVLDTFASDHKALAVEVEV